MGPTVHSHPIHQLIIAAGFAVAVTACSPHDPATDQDQVSAAIEEPGTVDMNEPSTPTLSQYGQLSDGSPVTLVTLTNANGLEVDVISYGGIITRLLTPDADGDHGDIVLGLDSLDQYVSSSPYFGAIIGRYGNRIANGRFELDGIEHQLAVNDGDNHLHGGADGFDRLNWEMAPFATGNSTGVALTLTSPDGDQGYPGTLDVSVTYELSDDNELDLKFSATTDMPTIVNLTHHSYFNLAGGGDILGHQLTIPAEYFTPVREGLIPTGELREVAETPFDFREPKAIGRDIGTENEQLKLGLGYDHNWVLKDSADGELVLSARLAEESSGRILEVWSVEPAVQFYSGNFLDGTLQGKGDQYEYRSGLCLEPQHFPDSPNQPEFPSTTLLPGDTYETRILYRFLTTSQ